jgi:hypothetical protein
VTVATGAPMGEPGDQRRVPPPPLLRPPPRLPPPEFRDEPSEPANWPWESRRWDRALAWPPFRAICRCSSSPIAANPRREPLDRLPWLPWLPAISSSSGGPSSTKAGRDAGAASPTTGHPQSACGGRTLQARVGGVTPATGGAERRRPKRQVACVSPWTIGPGRRDRPDPWGRPSSHAADGLRQVTVRRSSGRR